MTKIACFGYRDWAIRIFKQLETMKAICEITNAQDADVILFYGWSAMIPEELYKNKLCLVLHPSPLPKYRGGSPIQHQIINGEKESAVTIFKATDQLDAGVIYTQTEFSLEGSLDDIFDRIVQIGIEDTRDILSRYEFMRPLVQDEVEATTYKRRTPDQSEIFSYDFQTKTAEELYNLIRALNDPYPNAFIKCRDGSKLYITGAHLESQED